MLSSVFATQHIICNYRESFVTSHKCECVTFPVVCVVLSLQLIITPRSAQCQGKSYSMSGFPRWNWKKSAFFKLQTVFVIYVLWQWWTFKGRASLSILFWFLSSTICDVLPPTPAKINTSISAPVYLLRFINEVCSVLNVFYCTISSLMIVLYYNWNFWLI